MKTWQSIALAALAALASASAIAGKPETTASGLIYESLKDGSGAQPTAESRVEVHYRGTLTDGKEFDSSYGRGRPAELPLEALVPCWKEVLQQMRPGGAVRIVCPPETAYGSRGVPGRIPPDSTLNFVIELLEVKR